MKQIVCFRRKKIKEVTLYKDAKYASTYFFAIGNWCSLYGKQTS